MLRLLIAVCDWFSPCSHDPSQGHNFDLAAWAIEHERERGCPAFNDFIRKVLYLSSSFISLALKLALAAEQAYHGKPVVKPRLTFEEFTNNATLVERLRQIYSTPDEVDMLVAQELDPTWWRE